MASSIKITLDSENRENNKIIINGVNMIDCITGISFEWNAGDIPRYTIELAKEFETKKWLLK